MAARAPHRVTKFLSFGFFSAPGNHQFTVWLYRDQHLLTWVDNLQELESGNPETVLKVVGRLGLPSRMQFGVDVCVFRHNFIPMWEHVGHSSAERLILAIPEQHMDTTWIQSLMMFFYRKDLTAASGLYLHVRDHTAKISLWFQNLDIDEDYDRSENALKAVGKLWRDFISAPTGEIIYKLNKGRRCDSRLLLKWWTLASISLWVYLTYPVTCRKTRILYVFPQWNDDMTKTRKNNLTDNFNTDNFIR